MDFQAVQVPRGAGKERLSLDTGHQGLAVGASRDVIASEVSD